MDDFSDPTARLREAARPAPAVDLDDTVVTGAPDRSAPRLVRRGRVVRGAALSASALAVVAVAALVVPGALAPRAPLFTAAGGGGGESAAMSADSKIAMWVDYRYVAGDGLSRDGGRGTVWRLERTGDAESVLADAAAALGLVGSPKPSSYSTPEAPSWVIGPEDGSAPSLTLGWTGTGDWWYSDPAAYPAPVCTDEPLEGGAPGETYQACAQPEISAADSKAPSEAEARDLAAELFADTGFDVAPGDIRVTVDSAQTTASASLEVGGVATALEYSVAWSSLGTIAWASGHSVLAVERGGFDTVSQAAAVDRLADGRWFGGLGSEYWGDAVMFAADSGVARDAAASSTDGAVSPDAPVASEEPTETPVDPEAPEVIAPEPGGDPTTEPAAPAEPIDPSPEPAPTPETVTVTLEAAESTLLLVWDADGDAWLVPGYAYQQPDQQWWTGVVSLVEGVIALPEPVTIDPMIEPAPAEVQ